MNFNQYLETQEGEAFLATERALAANEQLVYIRCELVRTRPTRTELLLAAQTIESAGLEMIKQAQKIREDVGNGELDSKRPVLGLSAAAREAAIGES